jgi:hypothetical protein
MKALFAILSGLSALSLQATTIPYPNRGTIAPTNVFTAQASGDILAYFYGTSASADDQIALFANGVQAGAYGLDNHSSTFGQVFDLGHVTGGDSLVFVAQISHTYLLYSDPALNSDGDNHVYATAFGGETRGGVTIPAGMFLAFEDRPAGRSDFDYNDDEFVITGTIFTPLATPEPATFAFVFVAGGLFMALKFQRKAIWITVPQLAACK